MPTIMLLLQAIHSAHHQAANTFAGSFMHGTMSVLKATPLGP